MSQAGPGGGHGAVPTERGADRLALGGLVLAATSAVVDDPLRGWLLLALCAATAVAGIVSVRREPDRANPAWFLAAGAVVLVPAYALWYPLRLAWDLDLPNPGITDVLFLSAYGCFLLGLGRVVALRSNSERRIDVLDTLIVTVGLGVLVWVAFISPYLHDEEMSGAATVVAVSYTLWNLLLAGAVVRMLVQGGFTSTGDRLLACWVAVQLTADLIYASASLRGTFSLEDSFVSLYPLSFVLLGAALLHPTTICRPATGTLHHSMRGERRFVLVVPAALIAPVVLVALGARAGDGDIVTVAVLSAVLFGLVLSRVWLLFVDVEEHRRTRQQLTASIAQERRRIEENQVLLASLSERQMLSERLSRIQRKISTRAPLQEVLDAITQGAAELVHADCAALRFVDEDDPSLMVMASSVGIDPATAAEVHRLPVTAGVGGQAIVTNQLCVRDGYTRWDSAISQFASDGLQTALAAPVHLGSAPIGSLVVATFAADRHYSQAEQDALVSFAEHVSIALNDARSVRALDEALERATHQAMHDDLTGLPNRACFYDRAEQALKAAKRSGAATAVLLFDLDRFKEINDTLGHRYGDRVLRAIGPRIAPHLREADTVARLGGDEFCVLLPEVHDLPSAMDVAARITEALEEPLEVDGMILVVEASCGVAVAPDHGDTADLLLQRADIAMYAAKRTHQGVAAYDGLLDRNTPDRLALLGELRTAVPNEELVLHYQPQVDLGTGRVEGVEALVRWQHPRRGLLSPDHFVPLAEDTGYIHQLTSWVLDAALDQLRCWIDDPASGIDGDFTVAVNLSTHSLLDDCFAAEVAIALDRFGIPADRLVLEITETTLMADPERAANVLTVLADQGVRFAIDDFGTGYSSLASLRALPVHELKIDKSFVHTMGDESDDAVIVRSVIDLGHTLGLRTVAEGVEDPAVRDRLARLGCDSAQGYAVAAPMPPEALTTWLAGRRVAPSAVG
ncbi:MAG TPA: GGDEF domain-containing protein [Acidimicrobiales bacterium]|nr:GGDEF domain-containing protein [Acidimicrobiales bacterium]